MKDLFVRILGPEGRYTEELVIFSIAAAVLSFGLPIAFFMVVVSIGIFFHSRPRRR